MTQALILYKKPEIFPSQIKNVDTQYGFAFGELNIIVGRPCAGKSMWVAHYCAKHHKERFGL